MVIYDLENKELFIPGKTNSQSQNAEDIFNEGYQDGYKAGYKQAEEDCDNE